MTTKYAATNIPRHADKTKLVVPGRRAPLAFNSFNRRGIQRVGIAEFATDQRDYVLDKRRQWGLVLAPFNNDFGRLEIGNAIGYRLDHSELVDEGHIHQDVHGRPRGLNFAAAIFETEDGLDATIQYHAIRERDDAAANHEARRMVIAYGLQVHALGLPVTVTCDPNDGQAPEHFVAAGYSVGATGDVMAVFGLGIDWLGHPTAPAVRWGDHKAPARRGRPSATQMKPRPARRLPNP